jgi:hypothetical protein
MVKKPFCKRLVGKDLKEAVDAGRNYETAVE